MVLPGRAGKHVVVHRTGEQLGVMRGDQHGPAGVGERIFIQRHPVELDHTGCRVGLAAQAVQQGDGVGRVGRDHAEQLTGRHGEVDTVERAVPEPAQPHLPGRGGRGGAGAGR